MSGKIDGMVFTREMSHKMLVEIHELEWRLAGGEPNTPRYKEVVVEMARRGCSYPQIGQRNTPEKHSNAIAKCTMCGRIHDDWARMIDRESGWMCGCCGSVMKEDFYLWDISVFVEAKQADSIGWNGAELRTLKPT